MRLGAVQMLYCVQWVFMGAKHCSDFCKVVFSTLFIKYRKPVFFGKSLIPRLQISINASVDQKMCNRVQKKLWFIWERQFLSQM